MTQATRAGLIKFAFVSGAADSATAGIAVAAQDGVAITTSDILIGVLELATTTNAWDEITADAEIIAGGKVTIPNSASDTVAIWWMATDAGRQVASPFVASEVGAGAGSSSDITITGIATSDLLISVIEIDATTGAWTDRTGNSSITDADTIQCSDSTAGNSVWCMYMDRTGPRAFSSLNLQVGIATIDASPTLQPSTATLTGVRVGDTVLVALTVDETDYDILDEFASLITVASDDEILITGEPSPTSATAGSKMLCFYQKANDLA
jgi:hypothetical protein